MFVEGLFIVYLSEDLFN